MRQIIITNRKYKAIVKLWIKTLAKFIAKKKKPNDLLQYGLVEERSCDMCNNTAFYKRAMTNFGTKDMNGFTHGYMLNLCLKHSQNEFLEERDSNEK